MTTRDETIAAANVRLTTEIRRLKAENARLTLALADIGEEAGPPSHHDPRPVLPKIYQTVCTTLNYITPTKE